MTPPGPVPSLDRRAFLNAMAGTGVAALGAVALGRWVLGGGGTIDLAGIRLPAPRRSLPALTATTDASGQVPGLSPILTPTDRFFRIDTALSVPRVDPETWSFRVTGMVEQELSFSYDELLAEPMDEYDVTIACVSNGVGGDLIGTARWLGTPLAAILERAGIESGATQIVGRSVDGWTAGFPTEVALDGRDAIIAVAMNGEPLPPRHGFPARLIIPGLFGYVSATKWLSEIELTTWEAYDAYWVPRGWSKEGPVKTGSRIDTPVRGDEVSAGETVVAGVAWAPGRGIERVEVRVDEGGWQQAELIEPLADTAWVQWRTSLDLAPGQNAIEVRATDGRGEVQPEGPQPPAPNGAEGWHRVTVTGQA